MLIKIKICYHVSVNFWALLCSFCCTIYYHCLTGIFRTTCYSFFFIIYILVFQSRHKWRGNLFFLVWISCDQIHMHKLIHLFFFCWKIHVTWFIIKKPTNMLTHFSLLIDRHQFYGKIKINADNSWISPLKWSDEF